MPAEGISKRGTTPPSRTGETEHLWDRGVPKAHSKAENRRRKNTVYGNPVKPSADTPPEFWGERLPFFRNHEYQRVSDMMDPRPKKKRKPKHRPDEPALTMDGTDITRHIETAAAEAVQLPTPQEEERPSVLSGPSEPLPGYLRGAGKKRKRTRGLAAVTQAAAAPTAGVSNLPLSHPRSIPVRRRNVLAGRLVDENCSDVPMTDTHPSVDLQMSPEVVSQPHHDVAEPEQVVEDDGVGAVETVTEIVTEGVTESQIEAVTEVVTDSVTEQAVVEQAGGEPVGEGSVANPVTYATVTETVFQEPANELAVRDIDIEPVEVSMRTIMDQDATEPAVDGAASDSHTEEYVVEPVLAQSTIESAMDDGVAAVFTAEVSEAEGLEEEVYIAAGEDGTPEFYEEGTEGAGTVEDEE
ncbi:hypothetical protein LTR08_007874 [Meristemomyces frigidus]|nr:hypothetical protein LTR08_007874 [Meristemomyces frigidus]